MAKKSSNRSWGGRFAGGPDASAQAFTASIGFDIRLAPYDVKVSIAHATMLASCGIISATDCKRITKGLSAVGKELASGKFQPGISDEDIHMAIERRLVEKIGPTGAKLHAARSRNDQVVTDVRLFMKDAVAAVDAGIEDLQKALVEIALAHPSAILPGYTHLQRAQPILLGHHLLAYYDMLGRDRDRFADALVRIDVLPLGAGALAGTTLPIDRRVVAKELGFSAIAENSIDAVADRDFVIEFLSDTALLFTHLSRIAQEVTMWVSSEFGFATLADSHSTGSSMMPQKKNPDIAELVRGKSGRAFGNLMSLLTTVKGLPLAYNSDLQEDKEPLFDSVDTAVGSLDLMSALLRSLSFQEDAMRDAASDPLLLATDLAEHLVATGTAFRDAHEIVGRLVRDAGRQGRALTDLTDDEFASYAPKLRGAAANLLRPEKAVARRRSRGGTAGTLVVRRLKTLAKRHGVRA